MLNYKGYQAKVEVDYETGALYGRVINIRDIIFFEADSFDQLKNEFQISVDDYIAFCKEHGEEPDKPSSGKISLRVSPQVHSAAKSAASLEGMSLNAWISKTIEKAAIG